MKHIRRVQMDLPAEEVRQFQLQRREVQEIEPIRRDYLDDHIDIAVQAKVIARDGAKKRQLTDTVPLAESPEFSIVDGKSLKPHRLGSLYSRFKTMRKPKGRPQSVSFDPF